MWGRWRRAVLPLGQRRNPLQTRSLSRCSRPDEGTFGLRAALCWLRKRWRDSGARGGPRRCRSGAWPRCGSAECSQPARCAASMNGGGMSIGGGPRSAAAQRTRTHGRTPQAGHRIRRRYVTGLRNDRVRRHSTIPGEADAAACNGSHFDHALAAAASPPSTARCSPQLSASQVRPGQIRSGQVRLGQVKSSQVKSARRCRSQLSQVLQQGQRRVQLQLLQREISQHQALPAAVQREVDAFGQAWRQGGRGAGLLGEVVQRWDRRRRDRGQAAGTQSSSTACCSLHCPLLRALNTRASGCAPAAASAPSFATPLIALPGSLMGATVLSSKAKQRREDVTCSEPGKATWHVGKRGWSAGGVRAVRPTRICCTCTHCHCILHD